MRVRTSVQRFRLPGLLMAFGSLALVITAVFVLRQASRHGDEDRLATFLHSTPQGERLSIASLQANERVVIQHILNGHGRWESRTYTLTGGNPKTILVVENELGWARGHPQDTTPRTTAHELTLQQAVGIDAMIRLLRRPQPHVFRYYDTYEFEYVRDGRTIGSEKWVDFYRPRDNHAHQRYDDLPSDVQTLTTPDDWPKIISFRELVSALRASIE